ncbi:MAG: DUF2238 domain-containing protein [Pirellulales bacterium]|nr:DUF2238 domain-containing protein [Pirellulales bacterium]
MQNQTRQTPPPLRPGTMGVFAFAAAYLLPATAIAVWQVNFEFMFYVVVMYALAAVVATVHYRVNFSTGLLWALAVWGLLHMAGGLVPVPASWPIEGDIRVLYSWWLVPGMLKYDQVVHAYGFGTTTWACWQCLRSILASYADNDPQQIKPTLGMLVLCGAAALGFGALNELVEFTATMTMPNTNVGGYVNTGFDLVANTVGVVIACVLIRLAAGK